MALPLSPVCLTRTTKPLPSFNSAYSARSTCSPIKVLANRSARSGPGLFAMSTMTVVRSISTPHRVLLDLSGAHGSTQPAQDFGLLNISSSSDLKGNRRESPPAALCVMRSGDQRPPQPRYAEDSSIRPRVGQNRRVRPQLNRKQDNGWRARG